MAGLPHAYTGVNHAALISRRSATAIAKHSTMLAQQAVQDTATNI
jgi:hypothetical protein